MNLAADNLDQAISAPLEVIEDIAAEVTGGLLPFGFSKANQVVLERGEAGLILSHIGKLRTDTLLEQNDRSHQGQHNFQLSNRIHIGSIL